MFFLKQQSQKKMNAFSSVQFSCSVMSYSLRPYELQHARPYLSITNSRTSLKFMFIDSVMSTSHLILCCLLLLPPIPPSIRVFNNESSLCMRWPNFWSFSVSISPSNEYPGLDLLQNGLVGSPCSPRDSEESSPTPQFKNLLFFKQINSRFLVGVSVPKIETEKLVE